MNICSICNRPADSFWLKPFASDERLPLVERILGLLVESRFEDGSAVPLGAFCKARDVVPAVCLDLHPRPFPFPVVCRRLITLTRSASIAFTSLVNIGRERLAMLVNSLSSRSPSTLGRGSPKPTKRGQAGTRQMLLAERKSCAFPGGLKKLSGSAERI